MPEPTTEKQRLQVIMDTNSFFVPLKFGISLPSDLENLLNRKFEMVLLSRVKNELTTLATTRSASTKKNAEIALKLAEKCTYKEIKTARSQPTDEVIIETAKKWKAAVFTNDRLLRKKLRDISVPVIYVRQKSHLAVNGMI